MLYLVAGLTRNGPEGLKPLPSHPITGARPTGCEGGREGVGDGRGGEAGVGGGCGEPSRNYNFLIT